MKFLQRLFIVVAVLVVVLVALGLFLPRTSHVERSIKTSASPEAIYRVISGFRRFNEWSPWADLDPATRYTYSGPATGVGARMAWTSDRKEVGHGSQEIVAVEPGRSVTTRLDFGQDGTPIAKLTLYPDGTGTRIVWTMDSDFSDDYLGRYFGLLLDRMVGPDFEKGLVRLKRLVETAQPAEAPLIASPTQSG